jgi:hypothetical protein
MTKEEHKKMCLEERIVRNGRLLKSWLIYGYCLYIAVMYIHYMSDVCCPQIAQEAWLAYDESQLRACAKVDFAIGVGRSISWHPCQEW